MSKRQFRLPTRISALMIDDSLKGDLSLCCGEDIVVTQSISSVSNISVRPDPSTMDVSLRSSQFSDVSGRGTQVVVVEDNSVGGGGNYMVKSVCSLQVFLIQHKSPSPQVIYSVSMGSVCCCYVCVGISLFWTV